MERNIGFKERRYIEELRILTKSTALDCVIDDRFDRVIYVIQQGDMGLAIGKKGENIRRLQTVLGKRIEMVEYAEAPDEFVINIFKPAEVAGIERTPENGPVNVLVKKKSDLGIAIGKGGCNIEKARVLCRRFNELWEVICERAHNPSEQSYTSRLLRDEKGIDRVLEKVGEESTEFILAVKNGVPERTIQEAADLLFHLLIALRAANIDPADVMLELKRRRK